MPVGGNHMTLFWTTTFIGPGVAYSSEPGVLNGVSGEYFWLGQVVVPSGASILINDAQQLLIDELTGNPFGPSASSFLESSNGSLYASFQKDEDTFHYTIFRAGSEDGFDAYQIYVSDVQVVPVPGPVALLGIGGLVARRRRR